MKEGKIPLKRFLKHVDKFQLFSITPEEPEPLENFAEEVPQETAEISSMQVQALTDVVGRNQDEINAHWGEIFDVS